MTTKTEFVKKRMELKLKSDKFQKQMAVIEDAIRGRYLEMYDVVREFNGNGYNDVDRDEFIAATQLLLEITDTHLGAVNEFLLVSGRYLASEHHE